MTSRQARAPTTTSQSWGILEWMACLVFSLSSFVMVEPSPFETLFFPLALGLIVANRAGFARTATVQTLCLVALFTVLSSASLVVARDLVGAIIYQAITVYMLLIFAVLLVIFADGRAALREAVLVGFLIGISLAGFLGVLEMLGLSPTEDMFTKYDRLKGTYKDPNVFGPAAAFAFLLILLWRPTFGMGPVGAFLARLALAGLLGFAVLLTYSRASLAMLVLGTALAFVINFLVVKRGRMTHTGVLLVGSATVVGLVAVFIVVPVLFDLTFLKSRLGVQWYDVDRFKIQGLALQKSLTRPLGIGPGGSESFFLRFAGIQKTGATHNTYIRVLIENGWAAYALYLALLGVILAQLAATLLLGFQRAVVVARDPRSFQLLIAGGVTLLLHLGMAIIIDMLHWRHFFLVAALVLGTALRLRDCQIDNPKESLP